MMEIGESCKLCLKYVQGTNMAVLDETILGKLEFLQMDLDQSVEDSNSVCKECEERIEKAFDFKSCLVNTESCLVPYVCEDKTQKVNLKVVIEKDNSSMSIGETSTEKEVCRLCKNFVDAIAVISLPKILKDDNVTEVFQGHIPEMDLEVTENPVVCERCQKSLASFSTLVASWSIANGMNEMEGDEDEDVKGEFEPNFEMVKVKNETIDDFSDSNTTSSTSMLEISDSAKTVKKTKKGKSTTVKTEPDSSDIVSAMNREIKTEDGEEDESLEEDLQLKSEEVEIKDEDGFPKKLTACGRHMETAVTKDNKQVEILKCAQCQTIRKNLSEDVKSGASLDTKKRDQLLKYYVLANKSSGEVLVYKCSECRYVTKYKEYMKMHFQTHTRSKQVTTYKCDDCLYMAKFKNHVLTHRSLTDVRTYKCNQCSYVTKIERLLKKHSLTHKSLTEVQTFQCAECAYVTKRKTSLNKHVLTHKSLTEVTTYKCPDCPYITKIKDYLKSHALSHRKLSEIKTFNCVECPYVTRHKSNLNNHVLTHKSLSEVKTFQCDECQYVTKRKSCLNQHVLTHKRSNTYKV